jgi:hypothetical protein
MLTYGASYPGALKSGQLWNKLPRVEKSFLLK